MKRACAVFPALLIAVLGFSTTGGHNLLAQAPATAGAPAGQGAQAGRGRQGGAGGAARAPLPEGYWPRGKRPDPGAAPGMRVTDMGKSGHTYRLNFTRGDEMMSGLTEFAEKNKIKSAHFVGLGAIDKGILGWTDTERGNGQKMIPVNQEAEVISFQGSISSNAQGVATVHGHGAVALQDGSVIGGHIFELHISIIGEVWVTEEEAPQAAQ
jgi:predicted DNA-binding protein with PD1-like motif